jgi:hypothetical protein
MMAEFEHLRSQANHINSVTPHGLERPCHPSHLVPVQSTTKYQNWYTLVNRNGQLRFAAVSALNSAVTN